MRDFIVDALSEIDVVSDDLQNAECIGNPVKELDTFRDARTVWNPSWSF